MATHNDETLHERYAREHETELAIMAKMKPEDIYALSLELHNANASCDALRAEAEALRAENERLIEYSRQQQEHQEKTEGRLDAVTGERNRLNNHCVELRAELEAARGLLREAKDGLDEYWMTTAEGIAAVMRIDTFLTATPAPEVPDHLRDSAKMVEQPSAAQVPEVSGIGRDADHPRALVLYLRAEPTDDDIRAVQEALRRSGAEQGERQEAKTVCMGCVDQASRIRELEHKMDYYTTPQPGPDVRGLVEALDNIGGLTRHLRHGGPDPMDLQDLSDALELATDMAHDALAAYHKEPGK